MHGRRKDVIPEAAQAAHRAAELRRIDAYKALTTNVHALVRSERRGS